MFSPEVLTDTVKNFKGFSPSGVDCRFIQLDDKWGIKVYRRDSVRDRAHNRQTKMAAHGLAPQTGMIFNAGDSYCYLTEVAPPLIDQRGDNESYQDYRIRANRIEYDENIRNKVYEAIDAMKPHGFHMYDDHFGNFGWLGDKVVCIDFAEC